MKCAVPTYERAREPIRRSLIRVGEQTQAEPIEKVESGSECACVLVKTPTCLLSVPQCHPASSLLPLC